MVVLEVELRCLIYLLFYLGLYKKEDRGFARISRGLIGSFNNNMDYLAFKRSCSVVVSVKFGCMLILVACVHTVVIELSFNK